jgi:hypothetical protein
LLCKTRLRDFSIVIIVEQAGDFEPNTMSIEDEIESIRAQEEEQNAIQQGILQTDGQPPAVLASRRSTQQAAQAFGVKLRPSIKNRPASSPEPAQTDFKSSLRNSGSDASDRWATKVS